MAVKYWLKETRQDLAMKYVLFILFPVAAAFYSLRRLNTKSSYVILFLVAILFGMAFSVQSGKSESSTIDSAHYREAFENYSNVTRNEYLAELDRFFNFEKKDLYFETVAYALSRVTDNYHVFFMVIAIVFSYFSLKSLRFLTSEKDFKFTFECLILLFLFLKVQIIEINGVRFWTAYWVAMYTIFQVYVNKNERYYLLALITPFFHGTYWIFIGMLFLIKLTKRFDRAWVVLFFISIFMSSFAVEVLKTVQQYLPAVFSSSVNSYTSEDVLNRTWSGYGWIPYMFNFTIKLYYNFIIFLFIKNSGLIKSHDRTREIYYVLLIWVTVFNFFMFIPSLGIRNIQFIYPLIAFIWLVHFRGKQYGAVLLAAPVVFFWEIVWLPSRYLNVLDISFLVTNPLFLIYKYLLSP